MRFVILFNPVAGRGCATKAACSTADLLRREGHEPLSLESRPTAMGSVLLPALRDATGLIVIGGDGTVRLAAPFAIESATPIYQIPFGTENLFAREFGMDRNPATLIRALRCHRPRAVDVGTVNGSVFLMMVSVGLDAEVIHELTSHRQGAITHFSYVRPIIRQVLSWRPGPLEITIDGEMLDLPGPGMVVVANSRQYAFRFDPAVRASMTDGLLDIVYYHMTSRAAMVGLVAATRLRRHTRRSRVIYRTGRRVLIGCETPQRYQIDGDAARHDSCTAGAPVVGLVTPLEIAIRPQSLRVLVP